MRCVSPVLVFRSVALASILTLSACGGSSDGVAEGTTPTTEADEAAATTEAEADATTEGTEPATTEPAVTTVAVEDPTTTEAATVAPNEDEVAVLCTAYLDSISFDTVDEGLAMLIEILGTDAPVGVQSALETLQDPNGDIEGYFAAQNSLDGYVLPICRDRFAAAIVPAADDATAADNFVAAVRDGDVDTAVTLAPTNVIASFDWNGFPDATSNFDADNGTVSMLLEPTVTVFCQIANGAIEACAFGE